MLVPSRPSKPQRGLSRKGPFSNFTALKGEARGPRSTPTAAGIGTSRFPASATDFSGIGNLTHRAEPLPHAQSAWASEGLAEADARSPAVLVDKLYLRQNSSARLTAFDHSRLS